MIVREREEGERAAVQSSDCPSFDMASRGKVLCP